MLPIPATRTALPGACAILSQLPQQARRGRRHSAAAHPGHCPQADRCLPLRRDAALRPACDTASRPAVSPAEHPQYTLLGVNADVYSSGAGRIGEARSACSRKSARVCYVYIRSTSCISCEAGEHGLAAKRFRFNDLSTEDLWIVLISLIALPLRHATCSSAWTTQPHRACNDSVKQAAQGRMLTSSGLISATLWGLRAYRDELPSAADWLSHISRSHEIALEAYRLEEADVDVRKCDPTHPTKLHCNLSLRRDPLWPRVIVMIL